ncbi:uncharacterized protein A4U43_C03F8880 [Asparagus officinalis]|uniref:Uncharacterized protein n=2 Tax=Asparagus officinalis TaxID=4686 RepID=A0A5P1F8G1_ASPOF|nr:uncharacterized protein A4U43_C03F8880 [Asparagus officinalis]
MVRFSCFSNPSLYQRPKKVQDLGGKMHSTLAKRSEYQEKKVNFDSASKNSNNIVNNASNSSMEQPSSPSSHGEYWKLDYSVGDVHTGNSKEYLQMSGIKKSRSLGSILDKEKDSSGGDGTDIDDEVHQQFSFEFPHEKSMERINDSPDGNTSPGLYSHENLGTNFNTQHKEHDFVEPFDLAAHHVPHDSLFSIEVMKQLDDNHHADVDGESNDIIVDCGCLSSDNHSVLARSRSAANLGLDTDKSMEDTETRKMRCRSRSVDLHSHHGEKPEFHDGDEVVSPESNHIKLISNSYNLLPESDEDRKGSPCPVDSGDEHPHSDTSGVLIGGQEACGKYWAESLACDNQTTVNSYHSNDHFTSANEGKETETYDEKIENPQLESIIQNCAELNSKVFRIKRIEEWISQIDIENDNVEESGESLSSFSGLEPQVEISIPPIKPDAKSNFGMDVAYKFISSLTATSSSAQMANLGLVAVPFLSAFSSLRVLNLSGNFIVRITAGSLPRGLHMLNLSKNNIATIEGLRDLTRLRILDLSYNRIVRIGHGLASCSSIKELYLAGNKISEIEGLHRLLKLHTLDLRGNKISTTKGLGQLAANYGSLQAINVEGNPAQRNVGNDQLKKYLLSLLPNLVYYNKVHLDL